MDVLGGAKEVKCSMRVRYPWGDKKRGEQKKNPKTIMYFTYAKQNLCTSKLSHLK